MVLVQVPVTMIIKKIGYIKSAVLSNVFNMIYITLLMFSTNLCWLLIAEFISSLTFSFKDIAEPSLLNASIPKTNKRGNIYSKLEGKGNSKYNLLNGFANIVSGTVYLINPYLPLILADCCSAIACIISLQFKEVNKPAKKRKEEKIGNVLADYINDMKMSFKFIFKSRRLTSLLMFSGFLWGIRCLIVDYKDTILVEIGTSAIIIGIVGAILEFSSSIAAKKQGKFHKKFRNKSLKLIGITFTFAIIVSGSIVAIKAPFILELLIIVLSFIIINADNAMALVLINRYLSNFSNNEILPKIYSANSMVKNLCRLIIGITGSLLMSITGSAYAMVITGFFALIVVLFIIKRMKTTVGLKPEEYRKQDIEFKMK